MQASQTDRRLGALVHVASLPAPFVAPLVGLVIGWNRRFVRYQAIKSLVEQAVASLVTAVVVAASIAFGVWQLAQTGFDFRQVDWWQVVLRSIAVWLALLLFSVWNAINALSDAYTANQGILPKRPKWTERLAARLALLHCA